jgi:hypothetical protein
VIYCPSTVALVRLPDQQRVPGISQQSRLHRLPSRWRRAHHGPTARRSRNILPRWKIIQPSITDRAIKAWVVQGDSMDGAPDDPHRWVPADALLRAFDDEV